MNLHFKKGLAGMLVAASFFPVLTFAEDSAGTSKGVPTIKMTREAANFCARISTIEARVANVATKAEEKQSAKESDKAEKLAKKESNTDARRAKGRADIDAKRLENWSKMGVRAKTDERIAAVAAYKEAVKQAVTVRRGAIDGAVKIYRDGLQVAMTSHSTTMSTALLAFKTSVSQAVEKAKADCAAQVASKIASDTFSKSLADARKVFQDVRKGTEGTSGLSALKKTRDDAIKAAEATFKTATEKARADLMLVIKK
jgi:hypothetical protein